MSMVPYEPYLKEPARALRKAMTPQERKLWFLFLRTCAPRFLRQRPLGKFIVDFYCPSHKLAIEVDGGQHYQEASLAYDRERSESLAGLGVAILRFSNLEIDCNFPAVCRQISQGLDHPHSFTTKNPD